jgi:hypothetical protein
MRHSIATDKERLDARREQRDGGGAEVISNAAGVVDGDVRRRREPLKASADRLLSLAAAPTFAFMAVFTASHGGGMPDMVCSIASNGSPLTGMSLMYLLMSAFHTAPWLKLLLGRSVAPRCS